MTQTQQTPAHTTSDLETWQQIDPREHDIKLVFCDMDGTLLDNDGQLPVGFDTLVESLDQAGIGFIPASGRPFPTLRTMFAPYASVSTFVSENGSLVVRDGEVVSMTRVLPEAVATIIDIVRATDLDLGAIVCGRKGAYVERTDQPFIDHVSEYFIELTQVDDLGTIEDDILKVAIYDFGDPAESAGTIFSPIHDTHQVVVSAAHWIDIMTNGANKGTAVQALQSRLGVAPEQTVAFGDFFNDAEMLDAAGLSFAIGNAHPGIRARARYVAPTNAEYGVVTVLEHLLGR